MRRELGIGAVLHDSEYRTGTGGAQAARRSRHTLQGVRDVRPRPSLPGEADAIADLQAASAPIAYAHIFGDEPFPLERTRRRWRSFDGQVVVAEESGRIVGFVAFREPELNAPYVHPEGWGRGIRDRLLAAPRSPSAL